MTVDIPPVSGVAQYPAAVLEPSAESLGVAVPPTAITIDQLEVDVPVGFIVTDDATARLWSDVSELPEVVLTISRDDKDPLPDPLPDCSTASVTCTVGMLASCRIERDPSQSEKATADCDGTSPRSWLTESTSAGTTLRKYLLAPVSSGATSAVKHPYPNPAVVEAGTQPYCNVERYTCTNALGATHIARVQSSLYIGDLIRAFGSIYVYEVARSESPSLPNYLVGWQTADVTPGSVREPSSGGTLCRTARVTKFEQGMSSASPSWSLGPRTAQSAEDLAHGSMLNAVYDSSGRVEVPVGPLRREDEATGSWIYEVGATVVNSRLSVHDVLRNPAANDRTLIGTYAGSYNTVIDRDNGSHVEGPGVLYGWSPSVDVDDPNGPDTGYRHAELISGGEFESDGASGPYSVESTLYLEFELIDVACVP